MPNYKVNGNDGSAGNPYDRLGGNFSQIRNSGWSLGIGIQTNARVLVKKKKVFWEPADNFLCLSQQDCLSNKN